MSIIYDALKKVEESSDKTEKLTINKEPIKSRPKHNAFLLYLLIACLGIFLANICFVFLSRSQPLKTILSFKKQPQINKKLQAPIDTKVTGATPKETQPVETASSMPVETKEEQQASFILSGVFFSGDEGYALINNRILKEGDKIDGATVMRIALGEAELDLKGEIIKLSSNPR